MGVLSRLLASLGFDLTDSSKVINFACSWVSRDPISPSIARVEAIYILLVTLVSVLVEQLYFWINDMSKMHQNIYIYPTTIRKKILFEVFIILN